MNPFDPSGALLQAHERMAARERSAAWERMIRCCRQAMSLPARVLALRARLTRRQQSVVCAAC